VTTQCCMKEGQKYIVSCLDGYNDGWDGGNLILGNLKICTPNAGTEYHYVEMRGGSLTKLYSTGRAMAVQPTVTTSQAYDLLAAIPNNFVFAFAIIGFASIIFYGAKAIRKAVTANDFNRIAEPAEI